MNKRTLLLAIVTASLAFGSSCKDDDDKEPACSTNFGTELETELNAVINASSVYADDPTPANCNSYKVSYQAYINALRPYGNCSALTGQNRTTFNEMLADAEADVATLCQ